MCIHNLCNFRFNVVGSYFRDVVGHAMLDNGSGERGRVRHVSKHMSSTRRVLIQTSYTSVGLWQSGDQRQPVLNAPEMGPGHLHVFEIVGELLDTAHTQSFQSFLLPSSGRRGLSHVHLSLTYIHLTLYSISIFQIPNHNARSFRAGEGSDDTKMCVRRMVQARWSIQLWRLSGM